MINGWRAYVDSSPDYFVRDQVALTIAMRQDSGVNLVKPFALELSGTVVDPYKASIEDQELIPTIVMPQELAEAVFNALANHFFRGKSSNIVAENSRLRNALKISEQRLDGLIQGLRERK